MGWQIQCIDSNCGQKTWASNIVDLISNHIDGDGWLKCSNCGKKGYIEKRFELQEPGETWEPYLKGIIPLGYSDESYQPFVFLVSHDPNTPVDSIWFSYYKDLRETGGRLKLGYGPGGPPVLGTDTLLSLLKRLLELGCVTPEKIKVVLDNFLT